jgi:hypothetical protein
MLADFQGQGNGGYFGYGYLRILTVSPSRKTVKVFSYSPSIQKSPSNFPSGIPVYKTDAHNQFTLAFPPTFGGANQEITHIQTPYDGSHVPLSFGIAANASGPDHAANMEIWVDGVKAASYAGVSTLPSGTHIVLPGAGVHRVAVQTYDSTKAVWVKSVVYVSNP